VTADLSIENARIVDGTGSPWFRGAVGVTDGEVTRVSRREGSIDAERTVDADGDVLAPGFVDTHSHSDLQLFEDPSLEPKLRQGITTEVLGQDGFSMAPLHREGAAEEWAKQLSALAGRVDVDWTWGSLGEYFDAVEENGVGPNVAACVGHGTVRFEVLGMDSRAPDEADLAEMGDLVTSALDDGACALSTGLIYTPCTYANTDELLALTERLAPYGRPFVAHIRSEGRWLWEALDEFVDIGAESGVPVHLSHFKVSGTEQHGKVDRAIAAIENAVERGVEFTVEAYPYTAGSTMLSAVLPPWVHADGPDRTLEHLRDESTRERIARDITEWRIDGWENIGATAGFDNVVVAGVNSEENEAVEGRTIAEIATDRDSEPLATVFDLLVEEELGVSMVLHSMDEADVSEILAYDRVNICTDGLFGGKPHPRVFATYPRVLETYVRERNLLTLEDAVRKMTALPARAMGLTSKGVLRPGMDADLVVFDPQRVGTRATFERPRRYPTGIETVVVDGTVAVADGEPTGATPGRAVRVAE
jgi:N-acyl-D-amino-acid deacylase